MNIDELVTHYVAFRRTLGRAVQHQREHPPVLLPGRRAADAHRRDWRRGRGRVPGRQRTDHQRLVQQVPGTEGVLPLRDQPRPSDRGPAADGPAQAPRRLRPVHLHRETKSAGCWMRSRRPRTTAP